MWSIAICDDNRRECYELDVLLDMYCTEREIASETEIFFDGSQLYERLATGKRFDLVFLDIIMFGMDGIEVGDRIRRVLDDDKIQLIYMSCITGHADLLIPNRPIGFIGKPIKKDEVYKVMDDARREREKKGAWFLYKKDRMIYQVSYGEILYFQSSGRKVEIHMISGVCEFYGKLSSLVEEGLPKQFIQIHQSYIINRDYISCLGRERVYLKGHKGYFSISQPYRQSVAEWLMNVQMSDFVK